MLNKDISVTILFSHLVDGKWNSWGDFSKCSTTCGPGIKVRNRKCNDPAPKGDGSQCPNRGSESVACEKSPCPG